jgi:hypothetical protein
MIAVFEFNMDLSLDILMKLINRPSVS